MDPAFPSEGMIACVRWKHIPHSQLQLLASLDILTYYLQDIERLDAAALANLGNLVNELQSAQHQVLARFREIGMYDHCKSYGCCAPQNSIFIAEEEEMSVMHAFTVRDQFVRTGEKQIVKWNLYGCQFLDQTIGCGLPLRPEKCISYMSCVSKEHPLHAILRVSLDEYVHIHQALTAAAANIVPQRQYGSLERQGLFTSERQQMIERFFQVVR